MSPTPHTGPLWVTSCKSLGCIPAVSRSALGRVPHARPLHSSTLALAANPPGRASTGGGAVESCLPLALRG